MQEACEGIRGNVDAHETMAKLQERYFVLCKKAEQRVKNVQHLLIEWKRLDNLLETADPQQMDDYTPKQLVNFLRTYALCYA